MTTLHGRGSAANWQRPTRNQIDQYNCGIVKDEKRPVIIRRIAVLAKQFTGWVYCFWICDGTWTAKGNAIYLLIKFHETIGFNCRLRRLSDAPLVTNSSEFRIRHSSKEWSIANGNWTSVELSLLKQRRRQQKSNEDNSNVNIAENAISNYRFLHVHSSECACKVVSSYASTYFCVLHSRSGCVHWICVCITTNHQQLNGWAFNSRHNVKMYVLSFMWCGVNYPHSIDYSQIVQHFWLRVRAGKTVKTACQNDQNGPAHK